MENVKKENKTLVITAIQNIKTGEEVLVNYNGNPQSQVVWKFERAEK
jgi:predicted RecA/RadA family phage recombinase